MVDKGGTTTKTMCGRHHPSRRNPDGVWQFFGHPLPGRDEGEDGRVWTLGRVVVDMLDIDRWVLAVIPRIESIRVFRCQRRSFNWTALISLRKKICCNFFLFFFPFFFSNGRKIWMLAVLWWRQSRKFDEPCKWEREMTHHPTIAHLMFAYSATSPFFPHRSSFLLPGKTREIAALMNTWINDWYSWAFAAFWNSNKILLEEGFAQREWMDFKAACFHVARSLKINKTT